MKQAYLFPGQGSQFTGMGQNLFDADPSYFRRADELLGFSLTDIMFSGTDEDLKQTKVTQPAVFLHSVAQAFALGDSFQPDLVAGHSLGEFSALVAAGALSFEDGLKLVYTRALAMQKACEAQPSTMAAILGLPDETVENICAATDGVVVAANYNSPGQLVISGAFPAVEAACEAAKAAGAKRAKAKPVLAVKTLSIWGKPESLNAEILVNGQLKRVTGREALAPHRSVAADGQRVTRGQWPHERVVHPEDARQRRAFARDRDQLPGLHLCRVVDENVREFVDSQLQSVRSLAADKDEIRKLRVYRVALMWPERPDDGEIELRTSFDTDRMWSCAYLGRKPAPHLGFVGLDR
jgi:hypothetical protein